MGGVKSLLPPHAFMAWTGTTSPSVWLLHQPVLGQVYLGIYNGFTLLGTAGPARFISCLVNWCLVYICIIRPINQQQQEPVCPPVRPN